MNVDEATTLATSRDKNSLIDDFRSSRYHPLAPQDGRQLTQAMTSDRQPLPDGGAHVTSATGSSGGAERAGDEPSTHRDGAAITPSVGSGGDGGHDVGDPWAANIHGRDDEDDEEVDPDSCLPPHDGPQYVMVEKLREINAALEQEPAPDLSRQRIIAFSDHVTELLLPPDVSDADSQLDSERTEPPSPPPSPPSKPAAVAEKPEFATGGGGQAGSISPAAAENGDASASASPIAASGGGGVDTTPPSHDRAVNGQSAARTADDGDEKVLVEMEGKFELISIRELESMGYSVPYGSGDLEDGGSGGGSGDNSPPGSDRSGSSGGGGGSSNSSVQSAKSDGALTSGGGANPRPPPFPRPKTATVRSSAATAASGDGRPRSQPQLQQRRPHTSGGGAAAGGVATVLPQWMESGYRSPYGLTPEQRERKEQRERLLREMQLAVERREKEEERRKREENEEAFRFWLRKKQEEAAAARQQRDGEAKDGGGSLTKSVEREEAFREWVRHKKEQQEEERLLRRRQEQEEAEGYLLRTRDECERAYKEWLNKKEREMRRRKREEQAKMKVRRSVRTMSRKAIKLTKAIRDAQSFRYVDYYAYRF